MRLALSLILTGARPTRQGDVAGKIVDTQPVVVASIATNWFGQEGVILHYVFWHSIALARIVGVLVMLQAYVNMLLVVH